MSEHARPVVGWILSLSILALGLGVAFPLAAHLATSGTVGAGTGRLYGRPPEDLVGRPVADLVVPAGTDVDTALRLLRKAEQTCLITNTLNCERHLQAIVRES